MNPIIFALPGNEKLSKEVSDLLGAEIGDVTARRFPDDESYIRINSSVEGREVVLIATLDHPDDKLLQLIFFAELAKELGAAKVGLVAPYLAYMRQDRRFNPGEAVTSTYFSQVISAHVDWLVTIDPHLHRHSALSEIYSIPSHTLHAAALISAWIKECVPDPVLIGPDSESEQWVAAVAQGADAPFTVLTKIRRGDRDVEVSVPDVERWKSKTPVLVDDIISTARTMIETVDHIEAAKLSPPICVGVHAVFAGRAYEELQAARVNKIVTCDTIPHVSNAISTASLLILGISKLNA